MPYLILVITVILVVLILITTRIISNHHLKKNEENTDMSYTYLDAFGFSEFNLFNDDKGKHY